LACLLGGCASQHPPSIRPELVETASFTLNGRIAINHQGERHSAGLHWTHQTESDDILLLAPLGQTVAHLYSDSLQATLDSGDKHYQASDAEALMEQVLHWHLPLGSLHRWVLGKVDSEYPAKIEHDIDGRLTLLEQDGWEVHFLGYADDKPDSLPSRLQLKHDSLQVQVLIDEWEWQ
jgi:outer membrane lipoprotein LolB